jgi:PAS domain-containing protein
VKELIIFFFNVSFGKTTEIETQFLLEKKEIDVRISFAFHKFNIDKKKIEYVLTVVKDITEEKSKEIELQRFFNIVESSLNPILITDLHGKMIYVNPAFVKASGFNKEELIGKNPRIFGSGKLNKKFRIKWQQYQAESLVWRSKTERAANHLRATISYL